MFILYPITVLKVITKEGEEKIIPPTYYGEFSTVGYYILYDKDMITDKNVACIAVLSYADVMQGAPSDNTKLYSIDDLKEKFEFKNVDIIDTYYIRDVGTSKEFYVGDKIIGFKSGSSIYCPRKVIFTGVDFLNGSNDDTGSANITFVEDSGRENKVTITLSNHEYSYNKFTKNGYCPFYSDYYIEQTSLFGGIF